jgi:hypothetical protein
VLKNFGEATGAPDRKTADQYGLDLLWADWSRRQEEWSYHQKYVPEAFRQDLEERPYFRTLWSEEDGRRTEHYYIEDLRLVMWRYCNRHWDAPASANISQPGRQKGFAMRGAKIRELRNQLGLSQRVLGEECKPPVSARKIMRAEQGHRMAEGFPENLAATFSRLGIPITTHDLLRK